MATKQQAERELDRLGLKLSPDSGKAPMGFWATIDAKGRTSIFGDCRGEVVSDYTATASAFWQEVIDRARELRLEPCPCREGECDFHDEA